MKFLHNRNEDLKGTYFLASDSIYDPINISITHGSINTKEWRIKAIKLSNIGELTDRKSKLNRSVDFNKTFHKRTKTAHLDSQEINDKSS